jgi:hypothetical protein
VSALYAAEMTFVATNKCEFQIETVSSWIQIFCSKIVTSKYLICGLFPVCNFNTVSSFTAYLYVARLPHSFSQYSGIAGVHMTIAFSICAIQ